MALNKTPNMLDRKARKGENENWEKLDGLQTRLQNTVEEVSDRAFDKVVESARLNWISPPADSLKDLPEVANEGDTISVRDSGTVLRYKDGEWSVVYDIDMSAINEVDNRLGSSITTLQGTIKEIHGLTESGVNYYVDSVNGDDKNFGTSSKPFKSIQKAFNSIPKVISKRHTVFCAPGTYDEEPSLTGVIGGAIYLRAWGTPNNNMSEATCRVKSLGFYDVMGYVHIEDFSPLDNQFDRRAFILFSRCIYGSLSRLRFDTRLLNKITVEWDGSFGSIGTSYFSNQETCLFSQNGSTVRVDGNNEGTNNGLGLYAKNGFLFKNGNNDWVFNSDTPEREESGGKIYGDGPGWQAVNLSNGWQVNSGVSLMCKKMDDLVMVYGWVNKNPMDLTVIGTLPEGYRPINTQRHAVTVTGTAGIQTSLPVLEVRSNGSLRLVTTGDAPSNNGIAINIFFPIK